MPSGIGSEHCLHVQDNPYTSSRSFAAAFHSTSEPGLPDLVITCTGIPEPAALVRFAPAAGTLMLRRRRVRRN